MSLRETRMLYKEGKIPKQDFINLMYESHLLLNDYVGYIANTEVKEVIISADGVNIVTNNDLIMKCDFVDKTCVPLYALSFGEYEKKECGFILDLVGENDVVFDIGANHGWYSLNIAKMYPRTKIYAFEPIKKTFDIMTENIRLNNFYNIYTFNIGIGKENSVLEFNYNKDMSGATSMVNLLDRDNVEKITCSVCTLDSFVSDQNISRVEFIKCDIEGAELFALQGGKDVLKRYRPKLFIEMLRKWSAKFNYHPNDIISFMGDLGYRCFEIQNAKLCPFEKMTDDTKNTNFFFLHPEKHTLTIASAPLPPY
jgi:FkbM family methyltransferase